MHMTDSLLSPAVGAAIAAVSVAAIGYSVAKVKKDDLCEKKVPVMGVMGAFVFAAQMIDVTIPGTGSSGHIGGGILLAAMLGSFPAALSLSAVLIIQCLFFADGGLLALGCNIFNLAVVPCLIVYPLLFKPFVKKGTAQTPGRITAASIIAVVAGLQLGAFGVVVQTHLSGITALPFASFVLLMLPIHFVIGLGEGVVTAAVLCFVYRTRPEIMDSALTGTPIKAGVPLRNTIILFATITLVAGSVLSMFASSYPDGLEWSVERVSGHTEFETENPFIEAVESIHERIAVMPDYDFRDAGEDGSAAGTSAAGVVGVAVTFALAGLSAFVISRVKRKIS
ncbi:MAG: energy-coupling factor ABC transporter permease [Chitinispirillales bacterium]|nr:energy-coupling factor ABC transporter permease [Chitinispirillales bacterium]